MTDEKTATVGDETTCVTGDETSYIAGKMLPTFGRVTLDDITRVGILADRLCMKPAVTEFKQNNFNEMRVSRIILITKDLAFPPSLVDTDWLFT